MKKLILFSFFCVTCLSSIVACAPVKTLDVWKADNSEVALQNVMVIAFAKQENIRKQFENVISNQLASRGVTAIASHKVFPVLDKTVAPDDVAAKALEMGVKHVLVAKSVSEKEVHNIQVNGIRYATMAGYGENYSFYGSGFVTTYTSYDSTFINVATNLYDVGSKSLVWSSLSQVEFGTSKQAGISDFIPIVVSQLESSQLIQPTD